MSQQMPEAMPPALAVEIAALRFKALLTCMEVEVAYNYPVSTQEKDRRAGRGPCFVRLGRRVMYRREDLERYFAARRVRTIDQD